MFTLRALGMLLTGTILALFIGMVSVSAAENTSGIQSHSSGFTYHFTEEQQELVRQHFGTEMTMAEFWEMIDPRVLDNLPSEVVERWRERPYIWPETIQSEKMEPQPANRAFDSRAILVLQTPYGNWNTGLFVAMSGVPSVHPIIPASMNTAFCH